MLSRFLGSNGRIKAEAALQSQILIQGDPVLASGLYDKAKITEYEEGKTIIVQDAADDCIHFILSGRVAIRLNGRDIAFRSAGTHVGEMALIDPGARRSASIVALETTVTAVVTADDFSEIANKNPLVWRRIAVELGNRLRERSRFIRAPNPIPVIFVGSSKESKPVVEAIVQKLGKTKTFRLSAWIGDIFWPSNSTIEDLEAQLSSVDFALLVFGPDDKVISRRKKVMAPRDNILLECGMFFGAIGRTRTYILKPENLEIKIPSDLYGLKTLSYMSSDPGIDVSRACQEIQDCILRYGPR